MHESDIVNWMKKHKAQNSNIEYLMSKNEYKWAQEIDDIIKGNLADESIDSPLNVLSPTRTNTKAIESNLFERRRRSMSKNNKTIELCKIL